MTSTDILLIDGDVLIYRCGFAAQYTEYEVMGMDGAASHVFRYKKEADKFIKENPGPWEIVPRTIIEPVENAIHNLKSTLYAICEKLESSDVEVFLTGRASLSLLPL